ncbi:tyrosine-type recombinase/integrase [Nitrospirillum iridis]|uniref:Integrase n=1 Tax=Nitrospirillum iridis TaxID=765888 RepID=A0A7X0AZK5_9PROT|nr:site-specific integrase [Nitrospirillum iridis]MBB6253013.1 integrase [Nitrospirillum iridis]
MKLYKPQESVFWWVDFSVNGKRLRKSTKRTSKTEAREVAQAMLKKEMDRVQLGAAEELTIKDALERYLKTIEGRPSYGPRKVLKGKLIGETRPNPKSWFIPPTTLMSEITTATALTLWKEREGEGFKGNYIGNEIGLLGRVYNLCRDVWGVAVAPNVRFAAPKYEPKTRYLTLDEERRLLEELHPDKLPPMARGVVGPARQDLWDFAVFLLDTGCRHTEGATMTWHDVDFERGVLHLYRSKVKNRSVLAMTARLRAVLERRYRTRRDEASPYIFPGRKDSKTPRGYSAAAFTAAMERAGINDPVVIARRGKATIHTLRDTFATKLIMNGVSLFEVSKLLGHSTMSMTVKYAHLEHETVSRNAVSVLDKLA